MSIENLDSILSYLSSKLNRIFCDREFVGCVKEDFDVILEKEQSNYCVVFPKLKPIFLRVLRHQAVIFDLSVVCIGSGHNQLVIVCKKEILKEHTDECQFMQTAKMDSEEASTKASSKKGNRVNRPTQSYYVPPAQRTKTKTKIENGVKIAKKSQTKSKSKHANELAEEKQQEEVDLGDKSNENKKSVLVPNVSESECLEKENTLKPYLGNASGNSSPELIQRITSVSFESEQSKCESNEEAVSESVNRSNEAVQISNDSILLEESKSVNSKNNENGEDDSYKCDYLTVESDLQLPEKLESFKACDENSHQLQTTAIALSENNFNFDKDTKCSDTTAVDVINEKSDASNVPAFDSINQQSNSSSSAVSDNTSKQSNKDYPSDEKHSCLENSTPQLYISYENNDKAIECDINEENEEMQRAIENINKKSRSIIKHNIRNVTTLRADENERQSSRLQKNKINTAAEHNERNSVKEEDVSSWEDMFDESGDLQPQYISEIVKHIGCDVKVVKASHDYSAYENTQYQDLDHVIELYDFPSTFKTQDLIHLYRGASQDPMYVKWCDDTHALLVLSTPAQAQRALQIEHEVIKSRPLTQASTAAVLAANGADLKPAMKRPPTNMQTARRLITTHLGTKSTLSKEEVELERKALRDAREQRRQERQNEKDAWEGRPKSAK